MESAWRSLGPFLSSPNLRCQNINRFTLVRVRLHSGIGTVSKDPRSHFFLLGFCSYAKPSEVEQARMGTRSSIRSLLLIDGMTTCFLIWQKREQAESADSDGLNMSLLFISHHLPHFDKAILTSPPSLIYLCINPHNRIESSTTLGERQMDSSNMLAPLELVYPDCLRSILEYVTASGIGCLWLTGSRRIRQLLASGAHTTFAFDRDVLLRSNAWPTLLSQLAVMKLDFSFPNNYTMDLRLESMQPTVKLLKFNVSMDSQLRRYFDFDGSTPLIKTIFPELHTLEMPRGLNSPVDLRLAVPTSLTKLVIAPQITPIDNDLMKYLPHLTHLEGSCSPSFLDKPIFLPLGLETLRLCDCPTTSIFSQLKPIAGLKSLFVELTSNSSEANVSGWISHLLTLPQVLDLELHFHDQTNRFEALFMTLPPSLTRLKLRQHERSGVIPTAEHVIMAKFPPGLTDLDLGPILLNTPRSELLRALPSQLRRLHLASTEGSQALAGHELKLLPRTLTTLEGLVFSPTQNAIDLPPMIRNFILPRMAYSLTDEIFESLPVGGLERISASFSLTPRSLDHLKTMKRLRYISELNTDLFEILSPNTQAKEEVYPTQSMPPPAQESFAPACVPENGSFASSSSPGHSSSPSWRNAKSTGVPSRGLMNASTKNTPTSTAPDPTVHYDPLRCFIPQHIHTMHICHSTAAANRPLQLDFCGDRQKVQDLSAVELSIRELKVRCQRSRGRTAIKTNPKGPSLQSLSDFPSSLVTLHICQFEVDPSIFLNMSHCHNLENLVIEDCADLLLEDKHIFALPKQIRSMRVRGSPCMVTIEGYRALPPYLITLTLPICPFADEEMNKLDFLGVDAVWPKRCSTPYFNSPGTTLPVAQWIMVLKKRHKTNQMPEDQVLHQQGLNNHQK